MMYANLYQAYGSRAVIFINAFHPLAVTERFDLGPPLFCITNGFQMDLWDAKFKVF
jgi:hypothetical protein